MTRDATYHMALGIGDLSPLYHDEEYAERTRWGTLLAPYIMIQTLRHAALRRIAAACPRDCRACTRSGRARSTSGSARSWSATASRAECYLKAVEERQSKFGGGRSVYQTYEAVYIDQNGEQLGLRNDTWIRIERHKTAETKKYGETALAKWTPDDIERFMAEYAAEERATERLWDDVKVGDVLPKRIKGPLTPTAEIAFESQLGIYLVGNKVAAEPLRQAPEALHRQRAGRARAAAARALGQRVHHPPARPAGRLRSRARALRVAIQVVHRLDGRRRPPRTARVPLPQVQLHGRRHVDARAR